MTILKSPRFSRWDTFPLLLPSDSMGAIFCYPYVNMPNRYHMQKTKASSVLGLFKDLKIISYDLSVPIFFFLGEIFNIPINATHQQKIFYAQFLHKQILVKGHCLTENAPSGAQHMERSSCEQERAKKYSQ